jgi:hypothetical protein
MTRFPQITSCGRSGVFLDLSWVYAALAPYYSEIDQPSIDPALMIRSPIIMFPRFHQNT